MPPIPTLVLIAIVLLVGIPTVLAMINVETRPLGGEARSGRIEIWRPNEPAAVFDGELIGFAKHDSAERSERLLYRKSDGSFVYVKKHFPVNYGGNPDSVSLYKFKDIEELSIVLKRGGKLGHEAIEDAARRHPEINSILTENI